MYSKWKNYSSAPLFKRFLSYGGYPGIVTYRTVPGSTTDCGKVTKDTLHWTDFQGTRVTFLPLWMV